MVCTLLAGVNVVAFAADTSDELTDCTSVFRAYNPNNSEHLYTTDEAEYDANVSRGYTGEGEAWRAPLYSETEIWRAYNPNSGEHMLAPEAEVVALEAAGWQNEGLKMYSDDNMGVPIYRVFNPNATDAGSHHYCGEEEAAALVELGWQWDNEGMPVIYGCDEEPVVLVAITDVDQLSANSIYVEFDQDASLLVDKDDITVAKADGTLVLPINSMEFDLDGMGATLNLAIPLQDSVDYIVELNLSEAGFTASLGDPAYITVTTASAERGVVTPIEFTIYDEMGVDITSVVDVDDTCTVDVVYDDAVADTSTPSKSTITMNTVGQEAVVTVVYEDPDGIAEDIVGVGTITCIPAEAVVGYPIYAEYDPETDVQFISANNNMAKFYLSEQTTKSDPISVEVGKQSKTVYFSAANLADFSVYSYDEYEVESSDDDIMSVSLYETNPAPANAGKQLAVTVTGNQVGTANIVVKATVNETDAYYNIPVVVTPEGELASITYTVDKTSLTNAYDEDYGAVSTVKAIDSNGNEMTELPDTAYDYEVTSGIKGRGDNEKGVDSTADTALGGEATGFTFLDEGKYANFVAFGASAGKRSIKCTVTDDQIAKSKTISITVKALAKGIWTGEVQSVTYATELTNTSLFADSAKLLNDVMFGTNASLAAYVGSNFVGYVRTNEDGVAYIGMYGDEGFDPGSTTSAAIKVKDANKIADGTLGVGAKYGSKYTGLGATTLAEFMPGINLTSSIYDTETGEIVSNYDKTLQDIGDDHELADWAGVAGGFNGVVNVAGFNPLGFDLNETPDLEDPHYAYLLDNQDKMVSFARPGSYQIVFTWVTVKDFDGELQEQKISSTSAKLTIGSALQDLATHETVTVKSRNVDSLTVEGIKEQLYAIADMNNNDGDPSVLDAIGLADKNYDQIEDTYFDDSNFVKYAVVQEVMVPNMMTINVYVPINSSFRAN